MTKDCCCSNNIHKYVFVLFMDHGGTAPTLFCEGRKELFVTKVLIVKTLSCCVLTASASMRKGG